LLEVWLRKQNALTPPTAPPPSVATLTRYLSGALSATAAREVERGIIAHPATRSVVRQARAGLNELQSLSWAEVAERARGDDLTAQVAQAWLAVVAERVNAAPRARDWWRAQAWTAIRQQVAAGQAEAQAAWTAFVSFGQQWKAALSLPRLAVARGGEEQPIVTGDIPSGVAVVVTLAEITADGSLRVIVNARDAEGRPSSALANKPAHLALAWSGEAWEVGFGVMESDRAEWNVPALGEALGLPEGQIPLRALRIAVGDIVPPASTERVPVLTDVVDTTGRLIAPFPAIIEFVGEPRWKDGHFTVGVVLLDEMRRRYADYALCLDLIIAPGRWQRLGVWRVSEWDAAVRTLTAPCPGSPDAGVSSAFLIRPRLILSGEW
jgi:hypothetical protein